MDLFQELFEFLLVPDENFINDWFTETKEIFITKLGFAPLVEILEGLKNVPTNYSTQSSFDVNISIFGNSSTVSVMNYNILSRLALEGQKYIRAVVYVVLLAFNLKKVLWLIRGTNGD